MTSRKAILIRLNAELFKRMQHNQIDSGHQSVNSWVEKAIVEKLQRETKRDLTDPIFIILPPKSSALRRDLKMERL